jgi:hypothetical protein
MHLLPGSVDMFHLQPWLSSKGTILPTPCVYLQESATSVFGQTDNPPILEDQLQRHD